MRNFWLSTRAAAHSMRVSSDSFDISSEKTATVCLSFSATCCAMFSAMRRLSHGGPRRQDEQVAGVHARRCISSNLRKPVLMPLIRLLGSRNALMPPS